jgi:hypothetical protein
MPRAVKLKHALKLRLRVVGPKLNALAQVPPVVRLLVGLHLVVALVVVRQVRLMHRPCPIHLHHRLVVVMMIGGRPVMLTKNVARSQSVAVNVAVAVPAS